MMISRKYIHYVFVAIMAMSMTLILSFFTTVNNEGLSRQFVFLWLNAAGWGFSIAFPTALAVAPIARWAAEKMTSTNVEERATTES